MDKTLEQAVPRYTSYPTAPHFAPTVTAATYRSWLSELPDTARLSIYLHVPYCVQLCLYCGCHTKMTLRRDPIDAYARRLIQEIVLVARDAGGLKVGHIHWGGGTPSVLGPDWLGRIAEELARRFDLSELKEHAIELDPRHLTWPLATRLREIGVNRASLGVQEFNPKVQAAIGRIQPFEVVEGGVTLLREHGIDCINFDLMYGLPRQSVEDVEKTAMLADLLQAQRIAVFGYAHVPWFKPQQRLIPESELPRARERLAQAEAAHRTLLGRGYQPIGLDHYARPDDEMARAARTGRLHRNFQGYTTDAADALIGLGASAIGKLPQGFVQNAPDTGGYSRAIGAGRLATVRGKAISGDDRLRGHIIERLMCDLTVDLSQVSGTQLLPAKALSISPAMAERDEAAPSEDFAAEIASLQPFERDGLLEIDGPRLRMTDKGRPYVRLIAAAFDAYLQGGKARHSVAV